MPRILAVANPSSRSGKTSTVIGLARALVAAGQQVLAVDLDAQAGLTRGLGVDAETLQVSLHDVLMQATPVMQTMIDTDDGIDLVPATLELSGVDAALVTRAGREQLLQHALVPVADDYDWIIIDCASSMGLLTVNALSMAQDLLIPVREPSQRSMAQLLDAAGEIRRLVNPALTVLGVLPIGGSLDVDLDVEVLPVVLPPPLQSGAHRALARRLLATA